MRQFNLLRKEGMDGTVGVRREKICFHATAGGGASSTFFSVSDGRAG